MLRVCVGLDFVGLLFEVKSETAKWAFLSTCCVLSVHRNQNR